MSVQQRLSTGVEHPLETPVMDTDDLASGHRKLSTSKRHILEKYRETELDTDLETSFCQDTSTSLDLFDTKIHDWKFKKKRHSHRQSSASSSKISGLSKFTALEDVVDNNKQTAVRSDDKNMLQQKPKIASKSSFAKPQPLPPANVLSAHKKQHSASASSSFSPIVPSGVKPFSRQRSYSRHDYSNNKENILLSPTVVSPETSSYIGSVQKLSSGYDFSSSSRHSSSEKKRLSSAEVIDNVLHQYEIKEQLGKGAYASVFRATNKASKKEIAIKKIDLNTEDDIMELRSEINLLKVLRHPHIVKYHGFVQKNHTLNIFLEYCNGGSLRDLYKKIAKFNKEIRRVTDCLLTETELKFYVKQVLAGLVYLHQEGVVHRDIKAANILLTSDNVVKLADFGVSTKINVNTVNIKQDNSSVVGTPNWMAPEVISLEETSTASDIWSLGATIIELYTGYPPYHNLNSMAALHAIVSDDCPTIPSTLSDSARDFLIKCFEKDAKLRATAKELIGHPWLESTKPGFVVPSIISKSPASETFSKSSNLHRSKHQTGTFDSNGDKKGECQLISSSSRSRKISGVSLSNNQLDNTQLKIRSSKKKSAAPPSPSTGSTQSDSVEYSSTDIFNIDDKQNSTESDNHYKHLSHKSRKPSLIRNRVSSQASNLSKYIEKEYDNDDWDKDMDFSNLRIDEDIYRSKNFDAKEFLSHVVKPGSSKDNNAQ